MREFRKTTGSGKKSQVWLIGIDPKDSTTYVTRWGILDGKFQTTSDTPGSCGVEGHSDFQTEEDYAIFCMNREIRKKLEQGYVEYINGVASAKVATSIDFTRSLPKNLCFYKPKTSISDIKLKKLEKDGRAIWTQKRDGMMTVFLKRNDEWEIYSRRMDLITGHYPHIIKSLDKLNLPNKTILLGEAVLLKNDGTDDYKGVSRICRSKEDLALARQGLGPFPNPKKNNQVLGKVSYYVFDIPFYNGMDLVKTVTIRKRLTLMRKIFTVLNPNLSINTGLAATKRQVIAESKRRESLLRTHYVAPLKIFKTTSYEDIELAKNLGIEGFVVLDANAVYSNKGYSFDGKARRPDSIAKRKPKFEEEFIISGVYEGSGRNRTKLGGFYIQQFHPDTGERINCGKCGGGFSDDQRERFWEMGDTLIETTIKIEFDSRMPPKDGEYAVRFPVYVGNSDKSPEECIAQFI